jgi:hypothetical protein
MGVRRRSLRDMGPVPRLFRFRSGTSGSNPLSSSGESNANLSFAAAPGRPARKTSSPTRAVYLPALTAVLLANRVAGLAACPIALWTGDLTPAESYVGTLLDHWTRHALPVWHALGLSHQGMLAVKRGDFNTGLRLLRAGFDELGEARPALRFLTLMSEMAETSAVPGRSPTRSPRSMRRSSAASVPKGIG